MNYNLLCRLFPQYCNIDFSGGAFELVREVVSEVSEAGGFAALQGTVVVNLSCQNVIYKPESPATAACQPAGITHPADAVGTPKGIVKIADGCVCAVDCDAGKEYEIHCICTWGPFPGQKGKPRALDAGAEFKDPRIDGFSWIPDKTSYTRTKAEFGLEWWFK